jgi:DNA polymerase-3 subunit alpha
VLLSDAKQFGIAFEPPDVNTSAYRFEPAPGKAGDKLIRYGLGAVKGTGQGAIEAIVGAREGKTELSDAAAPFRSIFDFAKRVDRSRVNKRVVEALVKAGAFDRLHPDRAATLASVPLAFEWADAQAAHAQQSGLFDFGGDQHGASTQEPPLVAVEPWSVRERLTLEKTAIGFYLSGHMFDQNEAEVRRFCKRRILDLVDSREPQTLAGIVSDLRIVNGQRGRVAIFKVDDKSDSIEAVANEELLDANRDVLRDDELIVVQGKVQPDRFTGGLRLNVTQVWDLAASRARFGRYLSVQVDGNVAPLAEVVKQWPARREVTELG